jgi:hypothetical protein
MLRQVKNKQSNNLISSKLNNQSDWLLQLQKPDLSQQEKIEIIKIKSEAME